MKVPQEIVRILDNFVVPKLTLIITVGSAISFVLGYANPEYWSRIALVPGLVLQGEFWRIMTFPFYPISTHPIFAIFAYYFFYLMGTTLESEWGEAKFTHYIALGYLGTVLVAFLFPYSTATNAFITSSVFLAFAYLYPDFVIYLFFILPVKIKYLAMIAWCFFGYTILFEPWSAKAFALISTVNFFVFFGKSIYWQMRARKGQMEYNMNRIKKETEAFHLCAVCKMTEKTNSDMDFRVCLECAGGQEYCKEHLYSHKHLK